MNEESERPEADGSIRLQRFLAMCGVASRRACERLIVEGRVEVNGRVVTQLGTKVDPARDEVKVDGQRARAPTRHFYVALHKPQGVVCTGEDPAGRPRAVDLVASIHARLFPIGRLDEDSAGLLLMTNDGDFAQRVGHPSFEVPKVYRVVVKGEPDPAALEKLRTGIWLSEGKTAPTRVHVLRQTRQLTTLTLTLLEGKNREVRRMLAKVELPVTKLLRIAVGPVKLGSLKRGQWRMLSPWEVQALSGGGGAGAGGYGRARSDSRHFSKSKPKPSKYFASSKRRPPSRPFGSAKRRSSS